MTNLATREDHHSAAVVRFARHSPMAVAVMIPLMFATVPLLALLSGPVLTADEGLLITYPEQMLLGRWPNRDFFTAYGPGGLDCWPHFSRWLECRQGPGKVVFQQVSNSLTGRLGSRA